MRRTLLLVSMCVLLAGCDEQVDTPRALPVSSAIAHRTDFLSAGCLTQVYPVLDAAARARCLAALKARGYSHYYVYAYNERDYERLVKEPAFDLYADPQAFSGFLDEIRAADLEPVVWLFPDDSPQIHRTPVPELKAKMSRLVSRIDAQVSSYVLGLELDEYWSQDTVNALGEHLRVLTTRPIGVHHTSGEWPFAHAPWVDFLVLQYGFAEQGETPDSHRARIVELTKSAVASVGKPVVAGEYWNHSQAMHGGVFLGDAAMRAGAVGFGNGGTVTN